MQKWLPVLSLTLQEAFRIFRVSMASSSLALSCLLVLVHQYSIESRLGLLNLSYLSCDLPGQIKVTSRLSVVWLLCS